MYLTDRAVEGMFVQASDDLHEILLQYVIEDVICVCELDLNLSGYLKRH